MSSNRAVNWQPPGKTFLRFSPSEFETTELSRRQSGAEAVVPIGFSHAQAMLQAFNEQSHFGGPALSTSTGKSDVWMPVFIGDYLADTMRLSTEEHGAYLLLMFDYWKNGPLPEDDAVLARITRMSLDAWSNAKASVLAFFHKGDDGKLHQKRVDAEMVKAQENREKATERAQKAAASRWKNHQKNAQSNAQALLDECPSPSPSPIKPKPIKTLSAKKTTSQTDPRFQGFVDLIAMQWKQSNPGLPFTWNASEGKVLNELLQASQGLTREIFAECLRNRAASQVVQSERPRQWLANVLNYATGPLDRFGQPLREPAHSVRHVSSEATLGSHREITPKPEVPKVALPSDLQADKGRAAWSAINASAAKQINPHSYETWIKPLRAIGVSGKTLYVRVPTKAFECVGEKYSEVIDASCQRLGLDGVRFIQAAALQEACA